MEQDPLPGVAAHGLLNSITALRGLLSAARTLVAQGAERAESEEVARLISAAEVRTAEMAEQLQLLARGVPIVIDLDRAPDDASAPPGPQGDL